MAYFGGSSGMVGDPGFFGSLFGVGKRLARGAAGFATGGVVGGAAGILRGSRGFQPPVRRVPLVQPGRITRVPGVRGAAERFFPGGATGLQLEGRPRTRRMNAGNAKALRRAVRRTDAFVRLSKSALKNTGFKIVSKSSGKVSRATMDKAVAAAHHAK